MMKRKIACWMYIAGSALIAALGFGSCVSTRQSPAPRPDLGARERLQRVADEEAAKTDESRRVTNQALRSSSKARPETDIPVVYGPPPTMFNR